MVNCEKAQTAKPLHADQPGGLQGHPACCRPIAGGCSRLPAGDNPNHSPLGKRARSHPLPSLSPAALACWPCYAGRWLGGLVIRSGRHLVESGWQAVQAGGYGLSGADLRSGKALAGGSPLVEPNCRMLGDARSAPRPSGVLFQLAVLVPLQVIPRSGKPRHGIQPLPRLCWRGFQGSLPGPEKLFRGCL